MHIHIHARILVVSVSLQPELSCDCTYDSGCCVSSSYQFHLIYTYNACEEIVLFTFLPYYTINVLLVLVLNIVKKSHGVRPVHVCVSVCGRARCCCDLWLHNKVSLIER